MDLVRIAKRVAGGKRVSLDSILDAIQENCPSALRADVGKFIGRGGQGEAYEVDGGDKVLKVSVAKNEADAKAFLSKLESLQSMGPDVFCKIYDYGLLCDVQVGKGGTAYYYVMERLSPLPVDEAKIASRTLMDLEDLARKPNFEQERKKYMWSKSRQYKRDGDIEEGGPNPLEKGSELFDRMRKSNVGHRDPNSSNIMRNTDGVYKLVDLESAKIIQAK